MAERRGSELGESYARYYRESYERGHVVSYDEGVEAGVETKRSALLRKDTERWLAQTGISANLSARVLELGCGLARLRDVHPGWIGLEFSGTAVERVKRVLGEETAIHQGDMQHLPFDDETIDCVFSWAAIEHVPRPELVLSEIARVLVKDGVAILAPAWNCRPWTVKRLDVRTYDSLRFSERVEKALIPLRNHIIWRALMSIPPRVVREAKLASGRQVAFDYSPLRPDFSLKLPHIADDDALASMDPHAAIVYYKSRNWEVISHPSVVRRLTARYEPVVVRKP